MQQWLGNQDIFDVWSDYIPGRVVKVRFQNGSSGSGWGFRIDRVNAGENRHVWAQTSHPVGSTNQTWTIVNPNPAATSTRLHFSRIHLSHPYGMSSDVLQILDSEDQVMQQWSGAKDVYDLWSDPIPGRVAKVHFHNGSSTSAWGFRIDDLYPASEDPITPAAVNGFYIQVNHPGTIYLNDTQVAYAEEPGEYKVLLPGEGEYTIRVVYIDYTQEILVTITARAVHVTYLPVVEREF